MKISSVIAAVLLMLVTLLMVSGERPLAQTRSSSGGPYALVAGDRGIVWRLNETSGEMVVCRVDPLSDAIAAQCRTVRSEEPGAEVLHPPQTSKTP